jgi:hypothetical protein
LDFSKNSYGFLKLADLKWGGSDFSTERPLERFKALQLGPWPGFTEKPIASDRIPARGLTGGEGKVGEKVQELTAVTGVAGVEEERG